jgi:Icc-related predicted phosphoesterase
MGYSVSMKILTVSDLVVPDLLAPQNPLGIIDVALVLGCGDLPPEYLTQLRDRFNVPVFYVRGNHDIRHSNRPPVGCTDLDMRIVRYDGVRFMGLEGSRWYNGGAFQYSESQMRRRLARMRPKIWWHRGIDVVITHTPPRHVQDQEDRCHRGFKSFNRLIESVSPRYLVHGHIHRRFGNDRERITPVNQTKVVNCYGFWQFEIETGQPA